MATRSKAKPAAKVAALKPVDSKDLTAKKFIAAMMTYQSDAELKKIQGYFKSGEGQYAHGDRFIGIRMGHAIRPRQSLFQHGAVVAAACLDLSELGQNRHMPLRRKALNGVPLSL